MASLSNLIKTATLPINALNTSILNQVRSAVNSARFYAAAASKKKITAGKARPALTSGKKKVSAKKAVSKTAKAAKKADKVKKNTAKEKALKEKEKLRAQKEKEKERQAKKAEAEKAKKQLQAQKEKAKKEKEAEKEKLARQKEKERERAQKAKALAQEKKEKEKLKLSQIKAEKEKRPKRLPTPYSLFYTAQFQAERPKLSDRTSLVSFAKAMGEKWRALDETAKQQYKDQIAKLRPAYEEARSKYLAEKKASTKLSPYNKFIKEHFPKVKEVNPGKPTTEILKLVVTKWRELPAAEKQRLLKQ